SARPAKHAICYHFATTRPRIRVVEAIDGRLVAHREPAAVGVDGELDARVAELALHVGWALALLEQERGEGVAQAVRREVPRELGILQDPLGGLVGVGRVERRAALGAERRGGARGPPGAQRLCLALDVKARERARELLAHVHRSAVPALGRIEPTARDPAGPPDLARPQLSRELPVFTVS